MKPDELNCEACGIPIQSTAHKPGRPVRFCADCRQKRNRERSKIFNADARKAADRPKKIIHDYTEIDKMARRGRTITEMIAATGICRSTIRGHLRDLRLKDSSVSIQHSTDIHVEVPEPLIPPLERPKLLYEAWRERMGMSVEDFKRIVLEGKEAQRTAEYAGFVG